MTTHATARGHSIDETIGKRRWRTPTSLFWPLHAEFDFDLDAAAEDGRLLRNFITPAQDCLVTPWASRGRRVWFNCPWGVYLAPCLPGCRKEHKRTGGACVPVAVPGTEDFVTRAIGEAKTVDLVGLLVPTAPDTAWYRGAWWAASEVRLLTRISYVHADTLEQLEAPPGAGCTFFVLRPSLPFGGGPEVFLADAAGQPLSRPA